MIVDIVKAFTLIPGVMLSTFHFIDMLKMKFMPEYREYKTKKGKHGKKGKPGKKGKKEW